MSNLASIPEYYIELIPGYTIALKPRYVFDERTAQYMVHLPMDLDTPHGQVKAIFMMPEPTFKALIKEHGGTALRLFALVKSHFSNFRPMMRRSEVGL